ncbi:type II secretion system F family protein [Lutibacter sp. B2]|nr:type II secretion system F family protein [Lutibacter sp. B2]
MIFLVLISFLFSSYILFTIILNRLFFSRKRFQKRIQSYLLDQDQKPLERQTFNVFVQFQMMNKKIKKQLPSINSSEKLETILNRSGIPLKPEEFILFQWMSATFLGCLFYIIVANIFVLFIGGILGYILPKLFLKHKEQKRLVKFNQGLPDMITIVIGSLRAGFSFLQSLKSVVEESDSPIKEEINLILKEMQYGENIENALYHLQERMPSHDLELMIQSILIQRQVGGNLATILDTIVQTIRDRNAIERQVITLTAQGRLSGIIVGFLPVILGFVISLINPDYIRPLFIHPAGRIMIGIGIFLQIIGFILIRKLTTIEV